MSRSSEEKSNSFVCDGCGGTVVLNTSNVDLDRIKSTCKIRGKYYCSKCKDEKEQNSKGRQDKIYTDTV